MKDKLSGYRNAMDRSLFKGEKFTSRHKQEVLDKIQKRTQRRKDWWPRTLSAVFGLILIISGGYWLTGQTGNTVDKAEPASEFNRNESTSAPTVETKDQEMTPEEKLGELEEPYKEIGMYIAEWELPEKGLIPMGEKVENREPSTETLASYENGYGFLKETGAVVLRSYGLNGEPPVPTPEQFVGVFMGGIADILYSATEDTRFSKATPPNKQQVSAILEDINSLKLPRLKELHSYAEDSSPLNVWLEETIRIFEDAAASTEGVKVAELYTKGTERLEKMQETIELARE